MGSLVTAVASYLDIKRRDGRWLVRIDDIDPPRESRGAAARILNSLDRHGLHADAIEHQAEHTTAYQRALERLAPWCFYCTCSRRALRAHDIYPGTCRTQREPVPDAAIRCLTRDEVVTWEDRIGGPQVVDVARAFGDFVVRRRDGLWGYNLACAVDDGRGRITHILRGADLLDVTAPQVLLMRRLDPHASIPEYAHIPVLCFADGTKLSKQTHAPPLRDDTAGANVREALRYLGMAPPDESRPPREWLNWGLERWDLHELPSRLPAYRTHASGS